MTTTMVAPKGPVSLRSTDGVSPFGLFEELRECGNVLWDEGMRSWLVLDYETCKAIESDEESFPNAYWKPNPLFNQIKGGDNISSMQGEAHRRIRHFHLMLLSPIAVKEYRESYLTPILDHLMAAIEGAGRADLSVDLGDKLPPQLTAGLFGMPWQDEKVIADLLRLNGVIMAWIGTRATADPEQEAKARVASEQLNALILPYIQYRRMTPAVDFVGRVLVEAPAHYQDLSDQDVIAMCRELLLAAADTTTHGIANALYLLLTEPSVRAALEADLDRGADALVEEALRIYGSVQFQVRYARADCEIGGVRIRANESILLHHAAANRDPAAFTCPQDVDLTRTPAKKHLAFGIGPRACPGAALARAEIRDAVKSVFTRLPNVRLDANAPPPVFDGFYTRSWRPLHVVFG
jgi:cytochrome P450